jgi:2'-5' RNA ligase
MRNDGQLSLNLGGGSRAGKSAADPVYRDALYFAVLPDPEIALLSLDLASELRRQYGFSTKPRRSDLSHITLYKIGSFPGLPEEAAFAAMQAASTVRKPSFQWSSIGPSASVMATTDHLFCGAKRGMQS